MQFKKLPPKKILLALGLLLVILGISLAAFNLLQRGDGTRTSIGSLLNTDDELVPEPPAGSTEVIVDSSGFSPATVQTVAGWQVTWVNKDKEPHRIAADPYPSVPGQTLFDSESLATDESFSYVFTEPGTYTYYDYSSPLKIKGTILVK